MKSMTLNSEIIAKARALLSGNWGVAVGVNFIYLFLFIGMSLGDSVLSRLFLPKEYSFGIIQWIFSGALMVGLASFFISISRKEPRFSRLFDGFNRFGRSFGAYFMYSLFLLLWTLLLIIPGIIKSFSYTMTFYILADDPDVGVLDAITRSRELMDGNKIKYWCLCWRFFGWFLLSILTCGIGFIWLYPYMNTAFAEFYQDIKDHA